MHNADADNGTDQGGGQGEIRNGFMEEVVFALSLEGKTDFKMVRGGRSPPGSGRKSSPIQAHLYNTIQGSEGSEGGGGHLVRQGVERRTEPMTWAWPALLAVRGDSAAHCGS